MYIVQANLIIIPSSPIKIYLQYLLKAKMDLTMVLFIQGSITEGLTNTFKKKTGNSKTFSIQRAFLNRHLNYPT